MREAAAEYTGVQDESAPVDEQLQGELVVLFDTSECFLQVCLCISPVLDSFVTTAV